MEGGAFRVEVEEGVARCTMDGPNMNALGAEMVMSMLDGMRHVLDDEEVRVIVIRGEGGNFSTGADLSIMGEKMDPGLLAETMRRMGRLIVELHEGPRPVIAEVDGWAVGGAFGLAMASDITYATERARFFLSFVRISLVPDFGSAYFLARRVGTARAKEIALTGRVVDAEEALRMGMVNRVVDHVEISGEVMKLAKRLAGRPPEILAHIKRFVNTAFVVDLGTQLELEAHIQSLNVTTPEHREDVRKFLEGKKGGDEEG
ncbi:MAG: enoyl-CoA hydratase/isomerase family protein [Actinobacteria bacterium]|nr:enoyl-CoA hydratase/isomerase family protein [Actinomycetota bacterium]